MTSVLVKQTEETAMGDVMAMDGGLEFEGLLELVLRERSVEASAPRGLVQRLKARLAQEDVLPRQVMAFSFAESVKSERSTVSMWSAIVAHAFILAMVFAVATGRMALMKPQGEVAFHALAPLPRVAPRLSKMGGGGGMHDAAPVSAGRLPKLATVQVVPLKAPPTIAPKLAVEPSVVVQPDLKMANNSLPNFGMPNAPAASIGSLGRGSGGGVGGGSGNGIGAGSGGNTGGGVYRVGGGVSAPRMIYSIDAEFSEEARKAKFSGNVMVELIVDEQGNPSHVHVVRGVGMGLDEKAVEAVRQYRFRPAMKDGKPVKVDVSIDVNFQIF